jgi:hypothetical protein
MNDSNGYPLTMRLPEDVAWEEEAPEPSPTIERGAASFRIPDWRQSTRGTRGSRGSSGGNTGVSAAREPTFEEIMNGEVGMPEDFDAMARGEFPDEESSDDGFAPPEINPTNEREAFELFMNQGGFDIDENGELVQLEDVADALEELEEEEEEAGVQDPFDGPGHDHGGAVGGFDDDFVPSGGAQTSAPSGGFDDDFAPSAAVSGDFSPDAEVSGPSLNDLAKQIFEVCGTFRPRCQAANESRTLHPGVMVCSRYPAPS